MLKTKTCYQCGYKQKCCGECTDCGIGIDFDETTWFCSTGCQDQYAGIDHDDQGQSGDTIDFWDRDGE